MNKPLLLGAGATLGALLIAPHFIGNGLESKFNSAIANIDEHPVYSANVVSYEKGWFTTTAQVEVGFDLQAMLRAQQIDQSDIEQTENPTFIANIVAHHGPVYMGDGVGVGRLQYNLHIEGDALREYVEWESNTPIYVNEGVIGLFGSTDFTDRMPALTFIDEDEDVTLTFSGYEGEAKGSGDVTHYESTIPNFTIVGDGMVIAMNDMDMDMQWSGNLIKAIKGELFESTFSLNLKETTVSGDDAIDGDTPLFVMEDLAVTSRTDIDDDNNLVDAFFEYKVTSMRSPDLTLNDAVFAMEAKQLDIDFIKAYQDISNATLTTKPELVPELVKSFIEENLLGFLQKSPAINITQLSGTLPEGKFTAHVNTQVNGVDALPDMLEDPAFWVSHIVADAKVTMDEGVAKKAMSSYVLSQLATNHQVQNMTAQELMATVDQQVPEVMKAFIRQGFIVSEGDAYTATMGLADGIAVLNGETIPLPFAQ